MSLIYYRRLKSTHPNHCPQLYHCWLNRALGLDEALRELSHEAPFISATTDSMGDVIILQLYVQGRCFTLSGRWSLDVCLGERNLSIRQECMTEYTEGGRILISPVPLRTGACHCPACKGYGAHQLNRVRCGLYRTILITCLECDGTGKV